MKLKLTTILLLLSVAISGFSQTRNLTSMMAQKDKSESNKENILSIPPMDDSDRDINDVWLHWDSGTNDNGIGINDGSTYTVAARWQVGDLSAYNGDKIGKVRVLIFEEGYTSIVLKVWTGTNASNLVYQKQLTSITPGTWKETTLSSEILINSNQELWVGYTVFGNVPGQFPAGADEGPANRNRGDMIQFDGDNTWYSLATANPDLDYNWNIQFLAVNNTSTVNADFSASQTSITAGGSVTFTNLSTGADSYTWEFEGGNPSTSSQTNPTVTYNTEGTYNVTLTAKSGTSQDVETKVGYITVGSAGGPLSVEIVADPSTTLCEFGSTTLTASATGGNGSYQYTWTWDLGSEVISGNVLNINNLTQTTNVYLNVISGTQEVNETTLITVEDNPPASIVGKGSPERILICPHPDLEYQWFNNGVMMDGEIKQFYYPGSISDLGGTYYVTTTNQAGCRSESENYTVGANKGEQIEKSDFISVYPNPSVSGFNIELNPELLINEVEDYNIEIYTLSGMKVWEKSFSPGFNLKITPPSNLTSGIYILKLSGDNVVFDTKKLLIN